MAKPPIRPSHIAGARLRIAAAKKLGQPVPQWVRDLAEASPDKPAQDDEPREVLVILEPESGQKRWVSIHPNSLIATVGPPPTEDEKLKIMRNVSRLLMETEVVTKLVEAEQDQS